MTPKATPQAVDESLQRGCCRGWSLTSASACVLSRRRRSRFSLWHHAMCKAAILVVVVLALASGCVNPWRRADVRALLLASAQRGDPDFPDGRNSVLTHFSHVGQLETSGGEVLFVADRRAVLAGMRAPRGQNFITFFDREFRYLGKIRYTESRPLWCDGSQLYLFGELDGTGTGLSGNVIDVARGYAGLRAYHAPAYGSSGGIAD